MAQNEQIPHDPSLEKSLVNLKKECSFYWICRRIIIHPCGKCHMNFALNDLKNGTEV